MSGALSSRNSGSPPGEPDGLTGAGTGCAVLDLPPLTAGLAGFVILTCGGASFGGGVTRITFGTEGAGVAVSAAGCGCCVGSGGGGTAGFGVLTGTTFGGVTGAAIAAVAAVKREVRQTAIACFIKACVSFGHSDLDVAKATFQIPACRHVSSTWTIWS